VALTIDYLPEGFDKIAIAQGHRSADASALFARGKKLMADSDCAACHKQQEKSIGPSYKDIAVRYKGDKTARAVLAERVIKGTSGAWGETAMAAHPQLSPEDASEMIGYILSLVDERPKSTLPIKGSYAVKLPPNDAGIGQYVLRAAYEDNGTASLPSLTGESTLVLRNAMLNAHSFDEMEGCTKMEFGGRRFAIAQKMNGWAKLNQVDLRNVQSVTAHISTSSFLASAKGSFIELRLGSPTGTLVGSSTPLEVSTTEQPTPHALRIPVAAKDLDTSKLHDLYFVFTHPDKATTEVNMVLNAVQFQF
jgi:cytochrome c